MSVQIFTIIPVGRKVGGVTNIRQPHPSFIVFFKVLSVCAYCSWLVTYVIKYFGKSEKPTTAHPCHEHHFLQRLMAFKAI